MKPDKKYEDIVFSARNLFWKHGFRRVSIEDICRKANVSKMTFYKHFPNKTDLAKTIFNKVVSEGQAEFREIMSSALSPAEKIRELIQIKFKGTNDISPEFLQDFYSGKVPELKVYVENRTREAWDVLKADYKKAQDNGVFRKDLNLELLIKIQHKLTEMIDDESVTGLFDSRQDLIMEFANLMVYGIVPHE